MNNDCFRNTSFAAHSKVTRDTPTSTIVGLPEITFTTNENCNIEGSLPALTTVYHTFETDYDVLQCMYTCLITTFCQSYSWNTSTNTKNCGLFASSLSNLAIVPGNTSTYFSGKSKGCNSVLNLNSTSSIPFPPEKNVWVNTAVSDCSIEGTPDAQYLRGAEGSYTYDSVLTCQRECDTVEGCTSYSWNPRTGSCFFSYYWVAGHITPGETGVYFSDAGGKTGYVCYSDAPFEL